MHEIPCFVSTAFIVKKALADMGVARIGGESSTSSQLNAVQLMRGGLTNEESKILFDAIVRDSGIDTMFYPAIVDQLRKDDVDVVMKRAVTSRYRLLINQPYSEEQKVPLDDFWCKAFEWVNQGGVVLWFYDDQWIVISEMAEEEAFIFGAYGTNYLERKQLREVMSYIPSSLLKTIWFIKRIEIGRE